MLHGYAARDRLSGTSPEDGVSERLAAGALCIEGSDGGAGRTRVLIVTLDMIGVHTADAGALRAAAAAAAGTPVDHVLLAASHTHFAPAISVQLMSAAEPHIEEPDPRFVESVTARVREAAAESAASLESGSVEEYRVAVPSVLFNRRTIVRSPGPARVETSFLYPEDPERFAFQPVDAELTALRFRTGARTQAVLVNFGCHPVTGGFDRAREHYSISSDYPFYLRQAIGAAWGCPVFFTLGAAGDAVPLNRGGRSREHIGGMLGSAVVLADRALAGSSGPAGAEAVVTVHTAELEAKTVAPATDSESTRAYRSRLYPGGMYRIRVQFLRLHGTVFVALPFEVLSGFSLRMKRSFPRSAPVSVANGYEGYLPFAEEYGRGGYEATADSAYFEPGTADRLLELVLSELAGL
jgi:hypothetical protein